MPRGPNGRDPALRVVHTVGSDCAIGKMSVTLELDAAARARGIGSVVRAPPGQTGIAITGWGIAVDHVISDYIAGAAERLVDEGAERGELLFVEGQGSLDPPGLLRRHARAAARLVARRAGARHQAGATRLDDYDVAIPPLAELIATYEAVCRPLRPAPVVAVALNTAELDDDAARAAVADTEDATGLVADDPVRFGPDRILDAVLVQLDSVG